MLLILYLVMTCTVFVLTIQMKHRRQRLPLVQPTKAITNANRWGCFSKLTVEWFYHSLTMQVDNGVTLSLTDDANPGRLQEAAKDSREVQAWKVPRLNSQSRPSIKTPQSRSIKILKINQDQSRSIKMNQDQSRSIKIKILKINQDPQSRSLNACT